jgi:hypothetical protein
MSSIRLYATLDDEDTVRAQRHDIVRLDRARRDYIKSTHGAVVAGVQALDRLATDE